MIEKPVPTKVITEAISAEQFQKHRVAYLWHVREKIIDRLIIIEQRNTPLIQIRRPSPAELAGLSQVSSTNFNKRPKDYMEKVASGNRLALTYRGNISAIIEPLESPQDKSIG